MVLVLDPFIQMVTKMFQYYKCFIPLYDRDYTSYFKVYSTFEEVYIHEYNTCIKVFNP